MCKSRSSRLLNIFSKIWGHFTPLWCFKKLPLCPNSCHFLVDCTFWKKFKGSELLKWTASDRPVVTRWRADSTPPSPDVFALRLGDRCTCCGGGTRSHREWTKSDGASTLINQEETVFVERFSHRLSDCTYVITASMTAQSRLILSVMIISKCHSFFIYFLLPCFQSSIHPLIWCQLSWVWFTCS